MMQSALTAIGVASALTIAAGMNSQLGTADLQQITFSGEKGPRGLPGDRGPQGANGIIGPTGEPGFATGVGNTGSQGPSQEPTTMVNPIAYLIMANTETILSENTEGYIIGQNLFACYFYFTWTGLNIYNNAEVIIQLPYVNKGPTIKIALEYNNGIVPSSPGPIYALLENNSQNMTLMISDGQTSSNVMNTSTTGEISVSVQYLI